MLLSRTLAGLVFASLVAVGSAACSSSSGATPDGKLCTPGNYVFCRCEDRSEGTKLCRPDGKEFEACACGGSAAQPPTDGLGGDPLQPVAPGPPPAADALKIDDACTAKLGIVAGADDDTVAYVASYAGKGVFNVSKSTGPALRGPATIVQVGGSLVATWASRYSLVAWSKFGAGSWSAPVSVGSATTSKATAAAVYNGDLKLLYLGLDNHYHQGTYGANGWDNATASAEFSAPDAGAPIPNPSAPAAATVGSSLLYIVSGTDGSLGRETYSNGSWGPWIKAPENAYPQTPAIVALESGGPKDVLMTWVGNDNLMHAATRDALSHAWSNGSIVDTAASANDMSLVALGSGSAMLVFRASNNQGYFSTWSAASGFSTPKPLLASGNPELAELPAITRGRCGSDATLAYAQKSDGAVKVLRYTSKGWQGPFDVNGIAKAAWVGVGELP